MGADPKAIRDALIAMTGAASCLGASSVGANYKALETAACVACVWGWRNFDVQQETLGDGGPLRVNWTMVGQVFIKDDGDVNAVFDRAADAMDSIAVTIMDDVTLQGTVEVVLGMTANRNPYEARTSGGFVWYPFNVEVTTLQWI